MSKKNTRIAIIDKNKCKPLKCNFECGKICPVNKQKKECIKIVDIEDTAKLSINGIAKKKQIASIVEDACIGCGLCVKECPFDAIKIVNIPTGLTNEIVHRYGKNGFRLYRLPIIREGKVLGLIGQNGIGKSTVLQILSGKMRPNFEQYDIEFSDHDIIDKFKGNEIHKYMTKLYNNELIVSIKPQHAEMLISYFKSKNIDYTVEEYLKIKTDCKNTDWYDEIINTLELNSLMNYKIITLSGGELQRLLCAICLMTNADVFFFDEPTNYLDIQQRLNVSKLISKLASFGKYVMVIEHDLSILEHISDNICILYGHAGAFGVVSYMMGTSVGINIYFDGYIPSENMRFRQSEYNNITLNTSEGETMELTDKQMTYESSCIEYTGFKLQIESGTILSEGGINIVMGKNGTGKTTFINYIAKLMGTAVSHKPQYLSIEQFKNNNGTYPTVIEFLINNIKESYIDEMFKTDVMKPMMIDEIGNRYLNELSGGEMQRFWIVLTLGRKAYIYLLDEPSACLDIEQRCVVTKVIKRFILHNRKIAFVVEHDMMMAVSLGHEINAKSIIVENRDNINNVRINNVSSPTSFNEGINYFLKYLGITFHTQLKSVHQRPRINKINSVKDREQKENHKYYD